MQNLKKITESRVGILLACIGLGLFSLFYPKWVRQRLDEWIAKIDTFDELKDMVIDTSENHFPAKEHGSSIIESFRVAVDDMENARAAIEEVSTNIEDLSSDMETIRTERDALIAFTTKVFPSYLSKDIDEDIDEDWDTLVISETPFGQLSWNVHKDSLGYFHHLEFDLIPEEFIGMDFGISEDNLVLLEMCRESKIDPHIGTYGTVIHYVYDKGRENPVEVIYLAAVSGGKDYINDIGPANLWLKVDRHGEVNVIKYKFDDVYSHEQRDEMGVEPSITKAPVKNAPVVPLSVVPSDPEG